jgi:hypothetical protein
MTMPTAQGSDRCPVELARLRQEKRARRAGATKAEWRIDRGRFHGLHPDGRDLIQDWVEKAALEADRNNRFGAFIYAWIGLNAWASCCSGEEQDRTQLDLMMLDEDLTDHFERLTAEGPNGEAAERFRALWPIFKVADLPEHIRRSRPQHKGRERVISYYEELLPDADRAPRCHRRHESAIPRDWAHSLESLYRVRCNLFHGQKSSGGHEDRAIVDAAAAVLLPVAQSVVILR